MQHSAIYLFLILALLTLIVSGCTGKTDVPENGLATEVAITSPKTPIDTLRVLTFNILHGATTRGDFDLDAIAKVIIDAEPDFVALQEVDFKTRRAKGYDLATELGQRSGLAPLFGQAMPYDGGSYGEGVLSRYTLLSSRNVGLPHLPDSEPRAALEVTTILPGGDTISFIGTHLDHLKEDTDRLAQAQRINEVFLPTKHPTILAGDLNDVPGSGAISILESEWTATYDPDNITFTYPSGIPDHKIDYVMFYPADRWRVLNTQVINDTIASDHCSYLVDLILLGD